MFTAAAVVAVGSLFGTARPASAAENGPAPIEQRNSSTVTADPLPTVQIDSGHRVDAGGRRQHGLRGRQLLERPAGGRRTGNEPHAAQQHPRVQPHHRRDHAVRPADQRQVKVIKASPDGSRIYVGGSFNSIGGQTRFNIAAFDAATGALSTTFKPAVGGSYVNAIEATNSAVYVGGLIGAGAGVARKNLVAFNTTGALLGWAPTTDLQVDSMVLDADRRQTHRRGPVRDGQQRLPAGPRGTRSHLRRDPALDRALHRAERRRGRHLEAGKAGIWELEADANAIYGTGWVYADKATGNLEGLFSAEPGSGAIRWIADCHGDHYGVYSDGTNVYSTGHEHACETMNGMPQGSGPGKHAQRDGLHRRAEGHAPAHAPSTASTRTGAATRPRRSSTGTPTGSPVEPTAARPAGPRPGRATTC